MSSILGLLGGGGGALPSIGGAAGPSSATRGTDYNPVTSINDVGGPDLSQINNILQTLNAGATANGGIVVGPTTIAPGFVASSGSSPLTVLALIAVAGFLLWKFAK